MATQPNQGEFVNIPLPWLEDFQVQEVWWLLLAVIPVLLFLVRPKIQRQIVDMKFATSTVRDATLTDNRRWPRHLVSIIICLTILGLVYPAAQPVNSSEEVQEKALLIWVYDASESMSTVDVIRDDTLISRLDASILALEDSLSAETSELYKLLVSFAGADDIHVGLPTFSNDELLIQAQNILPGEYTATDFGLERAISACQQFFNNKDRYPCEIFLLSDGECNPRPSCNLRSEEITAQAATKGIVIHTISWGNPESEYRPNPADMQAIAQAGNGRHLSSADTEELTHLYSDVVTNLEVTTTYQVLAPHLVWLARGLILVLTIAFISRRWE